MREVKLLKIVEETVLCERDHIVCRYMSNDSWIPVGNGEAINTELSLQQHVVPIIKYCKTSFEPQNGHMYTQGYRNPDEPYVHTTYVAIDHHNSEFFQHWINSQNKELKQKLEILNDEYWKLTSECNHWSEKCNQIDQKNKNSSFWKRLIYLFTGKLND